MPVAVTAIVPGGRPIVEKVEVHNAGAGRSSCSRARRPKLLAGQRLRLRCDGLSAGRRTRRRRDVASSNAAVVRVTDGVLTARLARYGNDHGAIGRRHGHRRTCR